MKSLKRIITFALVFALFSFCICASAMKFDRVGVVNSDVGKSVSGLSESEVTAVCKAKIKILKELLRRCRVRSEIPSLAGTYMDRCGILQESYTGEGLKRSGTLEDFKYNVNQIIKAYKEVMVRYASVAPSPNKPIDTHTSKHCWGTRENRKCYRRGGTNFK